jgi:hypothetical protein
MMQYTEIDYLRSAGLVFLAAIAVTMAVLVVSRWLYRRRVRRAHGEMRRDYGSEWVE